MSVYAYVTKVYTSLSMCACLCLCVYNIYIYIYRQVYVEGNYMRERVAEGEQQERVAREI